MYPRGPTLAERVETVEEIVATIPAEMDLARVFEDEFYAMRARVAPMIFNQWLPILALLERRAREYRDALVGLRVLDPMNAPAPSTLVRVDGHLHDIQDLQRELMDAQFAYGEGDLDVLENREAQGEARTLPRAAGA